MKLVAIVGPGGAGVQGQSLGPLARRDEHSWTLR
jgi:hypothetical protein